MCEIGAALQPGEAPMAPVRDEPSFLGGTFAESDLQFYSRRAMEESRLAQRASCARAASAHRYLAASYSAMVKRELESAASLDSLARKIA